MNAEGRKGLSITDTGTSITLSEYARRAYVYNSGSNYVYFEINADDATDLVTAIAANEAYPIAPKASTKNGMLELPTIRSIHLATASGETSTVDMGWY